MGGPGAIDLALETQDAQRRLHTLSKLPTLEYDDAHVETTLELVSRSDFVHAWNWIPVVSAAKPISTRRLVGLSWIRSVG